MKIYQKIKHSTEAIGAVIVGQASALIAAVMTGGW